MVDTLPQSFLSNPSIRVLDPGCGLGQFSEEVLARLDESIGEAIPDPMERRKHILGRMLHMVELNPQHEGVLREKFGGGANIAIDDFLTRDFGGQTFDLVIGNPPYNMNGVKKVPTNKALEKRADGSTPWVEFVRRGTDLLKPGGYLAFIVPALWMKPDKAGMYDLILRHKIICLKAFSNTETNKIFSYSAQTPTCYFLMKKEPGTGVVPIYDQLSSHLVPYKVTHASPLPVTGVSIIKKLQTHVEKHGCLSVIKTNMPSSTVSFSSQKSSAFPYTYVHTCHLSGGRPVLQLRYGNKPDKYHGKAKLILAHKMYGFPYLDAKGEMGVSNRDNYVIMDLDLDSLEIIRKYLSTYLSLFVYECARYRMKFLERYAFEFLPNPLSIEDLPTDLADSTLMEYFGLTMAEKNCVMSSFGSRSYTFEFS